MCVKKNIRVFFSFSNSLSDAEFRLSLERYKPRSAIVDGYEREIRRIRDDIEFAQRRSRARSLSPVYRLAHLIFIRRTFISHTKKFLLQFSYVRRRSLSPVRSLTPVRPLVSSSSTSDNSLQKLRESTLLQRFNDLYARERLDAMDILRTVSDDYEMNQRICFNIVQVRTKDFLPSKPNLKFSSYDRKHSRSPNVVLLNGNYGFVHN